MHYNVTVSLIKVLFFCAPCIYCAFSDLADKHTLSNWGFSSGLFQHAAKNSIMQRLYTINSITTSAGVKTRFTALTSESCSVHVQHQGFVGIFLSSTANFVAVTEFEQKQIFKADNS